MWSGICATVHPAFPECTALILDRKNRDESPISTASWRDCKSGPHDPMSAPVAWARRELLRQDDEVPEGLCALRSGTRLRRAPVEAGVR
jgi:hypothetical protein